MKVIVIAAQKGGVGKTTISAHLGVELTMRGHITVLVDTDPQGSLSDWWNSREADQPALVNVPVGELKAALVQLKEMGVEYAIIDTPPAINELISAVTSLADLIIVPAKPSRLDLRAVGPTIELIEGHGKPMVFLVNQAKVKTRLCSQAIMALSQHGKVAPVIYDRNDIVSSMTDGRVAQELDEESKGTQEFRELCDYILKQLTPPRQKGKSAPKANNA